MMYYIQILYIELFCKDISSCCHVDTPELLERHIMVEQDDSFLLPVRLPLHHRCSSDTLSLIYRPHTLTKQLLTAHCSAIFTGLLWPNTADLSRTVRGQPRSSDVPNPVEFTARQY